MFGVEPTSRHHFGVNNQYFHLQFNEGLVDIGPLLSHFRCLSSKGSIECCHSIARVNLANNLKRNEMWKWSVCSVLSFASFSRFVLCELQQNIRQGHRELIVHGEKAKKGRYPYFVTLDRDCGGALIAPDIVLTAGHCKPTRSQYKTLRPRVGTYSFTKDKKGVDYEEFNIVTSIRHPNFVRVDDDEFINDFSIIQLDRSVPSHIAIPVKINRDPNIPELPAFVVAMGVGYTHPDYDSLSDVLKQVTLNPVSNKLCSHATDGDESYKGRIHASHMCTTGGPGNRRDSCAYDSGSPLIIPADDTASNDEHEDVGDLLVGLVSWGHGCADKNFPGVNARVSAVSDWIDYTVRALSEDPPADFFPPEIPSSPTTTTKEQEDAAAKGLPPPPSQDFWTTPLFVTITGLFMLLGTSMVSLCLFREQRRRQESGDKRILLSLGQKEGLLSRLLTLRTESDAGSYGSMESIASTTSNNDDISLQ